jgi:multidrug efflux system outer membrane protein
MACHLPTPETPEQNWLNADMEFQIQEIFTPEKNPWWQETKLKHLDLFIQNALTSNLQLLSAKSQLEAIRAMTEGQIGQSSPSLNLSANSQRAKTNIVGLPIPGIDEVASITTPRAELALNLSWEIDLWGKIEATKQKALADFDSNNAEYRSAQLSLTGEITRAWFNLSFIKQRLSLIKEINNLQKQQLALIKNAYSVSPNVQLILTQEQLIEQSNIAVLQAELTEEELERELKKIVPNSTEIKCSKNDLNIKWLLPEKIPASAISHRPDLIAAEAKIRSQSSAVRIAKSSLYPSFSVATNIGGTSKYLADVLNGDYRTWGFGIQFLQPLFNGNSLRLQELAENHMANAAIYNFGEKCLNALSELELLASQRIKQMQIIKILNLQKKSNIILHDQLEAEFELTGKKGLELLAKKIDLKSNDLELSEAKLSLFNVQIKTHLATGGKLPMQP